MAERRRTGIRGYIPTERIRPDTVDFVLRRRGPVRPSIERDLRERMDEYAAEQGIVGSMIEYIVHHQLTRRRLEDGVHFSFQCLAGHQRVVTADLRWLAVGDLAVGQQLLAFSQDNLIGTDGKKKQRTWEVAEVLSNEPFLANGFEVRFKDGTSVLTTGNHPWLAHWDASRSYRGRTAVQGWLTTSEMLERMSRPRTRGGFWIPKFLRPWRRDRSWEAGWLAGFFDGEGSIIHQTNAVTGGHSVSITASQNAGPILGRFVRLVAELGFKFSVYDYRGAHGRSYDEGTRQVMHLRISGGRSEALRFLGTICPAKASEKLDLGKLGRLSQVEAVEIDEIVPVPEREFWALETSEGTYLAEGFGMHNSSLFGGRIELGGMVVDFKFLDRPLAVRVMGEFWHQPWQATGLGANDEEQRLVLESYGWTVYDLWESVVMDNDRLEDWLVRHIDTPTVGAAWQR